MHWSVHAFLSLYPFQEKLLETKFEDLLQREVRESETRSTVSFEQFLRFHPPSPGKSISERGVYSIDTWAWHDTRNANHEASDYVA